ncbi:MAG TPA: SurA N-terminal domain-containing protein, partial [Verrucomicrobiae bacterium]
MIGTIRKHSAWLWWIIASLTIISFVVFMSSAPTRGGRGGAGGTYGTIYGHELTGEEVARARNDFAIYFLLNYGEWPEKSRNINAYQIDQQTYVNLLLALKAKAMGVSVPEDAVAEAAGRLLGAPSLVRSFGGNGPVPMDKFVEYVLKPKNLTVDDFQHSVRFQIAADQLRKTLGLSGALVPPQEASGLYDRENQQAAAQVVFFSSSNYVSKVTVSPAVVAQFYTNRQAAYRVPERMTLNYVYFNVTNYLAQAKAEWAKTNFDQLVDSLYKQNMATMFKDTKADDAKAKIREELVFKRAMADANDQAAAFVTELFAMSPVNPNNLVTLAQKQNLAPKVTAPFAAGNQPVEFANAPNLMRSVYNLNGETPYTDRVMGEDGFYVVGLGQEYPSYNPNYTDIAERVKLDYLNESAAALARQAATNFSI